MLLKVSLYRMFHCWNNEMNDWMIISFMKTWSFGSLVCPFCCGKHTVGESDETECYPDDFLIPGNIGYQSLPAGPLGKPQAGRWGKAAAPSVWHLVQDAFSQMQSEVSGLPSKTHCFITGFDPLTQRGRLRLWLLTPVAEHGNQKALGRVHLLPRCPSEL